MVRKNILTSLALGLTAVLLPATASAHVVVKPGEIGVGAFQTYTTSVPNERDVPVTALRLTIPAGLQEVTPTVKPGWDVTTKKSGDIITEIDWDGGSIPAGMRDDFTFSAQAPAKAGTLQWKAYQTYQDGTVVSWNQAPATGEDDDDASTSGPYSTTKVVDDLTDDNTADTKSTGSAGTYVLAGVALAVAIVALLRRHR